MKILQYIKVVLICGLPIVFYHLFYMIRYAKHPEKYPFEKRYRVARKEIRMVFKHFHVDYKLENYEMFTKLDKKCLIISNHYSLFDPLALIAASDKPLTFVCKKEVFKMPFVGKVAKAIDCFALDRENLMNQFSQIRNIVSYLKDESKPSVLVFIEGTRNKDPGTPCLDFHPGTLKIAQMANVPLLCGATFGSFRILDKKSHIKKYPYFFNLFKKLEVEEAKSYNTTELAPILQKETDANINLLRNKDKDYINSLKMSDKKRKLETRFDISVNS